MRNANSHLPFQRVGQFFQGEELIWTLANIQGVDICSVTFLLNVC